MDLSSEGLILLPPIYVWHSHIYTGVRGLARSHTHASMLSNRGDDDNALATQERTVTRVLVFVSARIRASFMVGTVIAD